MSIFVPSPDVQVVPAATAIRTDHCPLAHCWNWVPPTQFHCPSVVQAVPAVKAFPELGVPVLTEVAEDTTGDASAEVATLGAADAIGAEDATGAAVLAAAVVATVMKTPPVADGILLGEAADVATDAADVMVDAASVAADAPPVGITADAPVAVAPQAPIAGWRAEEVC